MLPPMRLSRDLLIRSITYKLQERPHGGLNVVSKVSGAGFCAPPISLKAGTRLVREWRGVTQTVLVQADGFEWNGWRYLSQSSPDRSPGPIGRVRVFSA
jgi:hypothetical protein